MGLFSRTPRNTISDERWGKIQRGAVRAEAREGGMFGRKAVARRKMFGEQKSKSRWS